MADRRARFAFVGALCHGSASRRPTPSLHSPWAFIPSPPRKDPTAANSDECVEHVARAEVEDGGLFAHQSEHASFQIVTPKASIRLSHGRLHRLAMRDPPDQYDLPDHSAWQMNMAVDHIEVSHVYAYQIRRDGLSRKN